jgi:hypothetical protein
MSTMSFFGSSDDDESIMIDPDRPPISRSDHRKLKNQVKSKAKKSPEEIEKLRM